MSCVVAGLRYYFRIYKYEYLGELMTSELHILYIYFSQNKMNLFVLPGIVSESIAALF